jgi:hypothetical protein
MVIRRGVEWLLVLGVLALLTIMPLYNGYRAYASMDRFIQDLPMLLRDHAAASDSRENGTGTLSLAEDVADASTTIESSFLDATPLYDVRSADGGSLYSPLNEQSLPICRFLDEGFVVPPATGGFSSPSRHLESPSLYPWMQMISRYLESILEVFLESPTLDQQIH